MPRAAPGRRETTWLGRLACVAAMGVLSASTAIGWSLAVGDPSGNRVAPGKGTFPRWQAGVTATDTPLRWLVAVPPHRIAAVERDGTLLVFDVTRAGLTTIARYGDLVGPDAPPVVLALDAERSAVALVGRDGRLILWTDGTLRSYDVGATLSRFTLPTPVNVAGRSWDDLLAVGTDGGVLLIGNLPSAPRILARVEARALLDSRITLADLDGDGVPEALVLTDGSDRYRPSALGHALEATAVTVLGLPVNGLIIRARHSLAAPGVFEELSPVLARMNGALPAVLIARSTPQDGAVLTMLGWKDGGMAQLAEAAPVAQGGRWSHVLGGVDLSGDGLPEAVAVRAPHQGGVVTAYRRRGSALVAMAWAVGYSSHAAGSRNLEQALLADLDGNGRVEVVVPRQSRDAIAGLELESSRFVERWSASLRGPIESNLLAADLDGDGLLDLAVADRRGLNVFLSVR